MRSRHQLHGFFLKPRGFEEANASTDSRRFGPSGTTGNGVAGRLYSAWTNTLTTTIGASFNTFGARTSLDAFKGLDYGGPRVLVYDSANTSAGRLVGNGLVATIGNNQSFNVTPASKLTVQADVSWFRTGWMGSHEFQTGVFIQPLMRLSTEIELPQWRIHPRGGPTARSRGPELGLHSLPPSVRRSISVGVYH